MPSGKRLPGNPFKWPWQKRLLRKNMSRLCIECTYYRYDGRYADKHRCHRNYGPVWDVVTGVETNEGSVACYGQRTNGECGPGGKYWKKGEGK